MWPILLFLIQMIISRHPQISSLIILNKFKIVSCICQRTFNNILIIIILHQKSINEYDDTFLISY